MNKSRLILIAAASILLILATSFDMGHPTAWDQEPLYNILDKAYSLSAEGEESSESITTFSETLDDDVLFYPDMFFNTTNHLIISDSNVTPIELGVYTNTYYSDPATWRAYTNSSYGPPYESIMVCIFTVLSGDYSVEGIKLSFEMARAGGADSSYWQIYNFDTGSYDTIGNISSSYQWYYHTTYDPDYWDTTTDRAYVRMYTRDDTQPAYSLVDVDAAWLQVYTMHLADSDHYAESFVDVSDWSAMISATISSDGDVVNCTSSAAMDGMIITGLSVSADYVEIYYNVTDGFTLDFYNGSWQFSVISLTSTSYMAARAPIHSYNTITQIRVRAMGASARSFYSDYLRVGLATEMGFSHDGSTTVGVTDGGGGSSSSDGDYLSMVADLDGSTFEIAVDTTAMASNLSAIYYSFLSTSFHSGDSADYIEVESYDGAAWATIIANTTIGTATHRANIRKIDLTVEKFRLSVNPSATVRMDWFKAFSIANFTTYSGPASIDVDDYCYVDSGALISSDGLTYPEFMTWDHDPALSVAVATYNVWNITADSINPTSDTDFLFYATVGGSETLEGTDESRDVWSNTGILTDLKIVVYSTMAVGAIKFWEDNTAPTIPTTWATPYSPTEEDDVTLSIYTADWTDLYKVTLNAIDYPATFLDIDYNCSKNSEDTDLWTYTFNHTDLPAGYYAFVVTADDGANTVTDIIIFRSILVSLQITDIVLITATETLAQISGHSNKDASYDIYENDSIQGSGSISQGWFSIAWLKETAAGTYVQLGIQFYTAVYTEWVNGSYSVAAAETFKVAAWWLDLDLGGSSPMVEGYVHTTWENATVDIYDNETLQVSVTEGTGGVFFYWWMSEVQGLHEITLNITSGAITHTKTRSYYIPDWAVTGLVVRWDIWTFQNNYTMITLESNWMNCTYYVYLNSSLVATASVDPVTLNFTRDINVGEYNLTIYADGGNQDYTIKNIRYIITEEGVTYDYSEVTITGGGHADYWGDVYQTYNVPEGLYMSADVVFIIILSALLVPVTLYLILDKLEILRRLKMRSG